MGCKEAFGIYPRYDWALDYFGGRTDASFLSYTKIFFANGKLDPGRLFIIKMVEQLGSKVFCLIISICCLFDI